MHTILYNNICGLIVINKFSSSSGAVEKKLKNKNKKKDKMVGIYVEIILKGLSFSRIIVVIYFFVFFFFGRRVFCVIVGERSKGLVRACFHLQSVLDLCFKYTGFLID